ncbi:hypothetical protein SAY86_023495 [Trapa natans]|uniref:Uncharacterized protein n=1 Tax=Trapa natans TaxID=22666 RepID=A0AAN7MAU3_TRANT|nr:hypothetical protein SAY86_023495 [Trapa natans]
MHDNHNHGGKKYAHWKWGDSEITSNHMKICYDNTYTWTAPPFTETTITWVKIGTTGNGNEKLHPVLELYINECLLHCLYIYLQQPKIEGPTKVQLYAAFISNRNFIYAANINIIEIPHNNSSIQFRDPSIVSFCSKKTDPQHHFPFLL